MSRWSEYKEKLGETRPWDVLNPNSPRSQQDLASGRYDICLSCDRFINLTKQCRECGCIMTAKTKLANASCPLGKW
jgi:hypothetical protein